MNTENRWLVNLVGNRGCSMSKLLQNSGTRLPQLMNTSVFHQNVGEGNKSLNAMSPTLFSAKRLVMGLTVRD